MIPQSHVLTAYFPSRNEVIFSETARRVTPGKQEVFFHFGAAYGLAADGLRSDLNKAVSGPAGASKGAPWEFGIEQPDGSIKPVDEESWPVMYWNFRYYMTEGPAPAHTVSPHEYHVVHNIVMAMES